MCRLYHVNCSCFQHRSGDPLAVLGFPRTVATILVNCEDNSQSHFGYNHSVANPPCLSQPATTLVQDGFCSHCLSSRTWTGVGPRPDAEMVGIGEQIATHAEEFSTIFGRYLRSFESGIPEINAFRLFDRRVRETFDYVFLAIANLAFEIYLRESDARAQGARYVYPNKNAIINLWKHLGVVRRYNMVAEANAPVREVSPPLPQLLEHAELSDLTEEDCCIRGNPMGRRRERQEDQRAEYPCKTPCGHVFGYNCIYNWIIGHQNHNCPMCRATFSPSTYQFPDQDDGSRMWLVVLIQDINIYPTPPPTLPPPRTPSLPPTLASSSSRGESRRNLSN
ncbi:hypothetical protein HYALB_00007840 [Hymenoscyphus albidus]|uniref:RING-type domain-containing protein n=1 Tax=Hymenoscyphus albidus TaxID=595503 RepID=A0A9N9LFV6_9HELO|nr:hypothetical protein HYALB_00007840 [Hymenoscyphus albidus]